MIPVSKPFLADSDFESLSKAFKSGWISSIGAELREFEAAFAEYIGVSDCVSTSNGTTALQLALSALDIKHGDEVIIPDLTFAAVANAVIAVGAKPICVDVCFTSWNMDKTAAMNAVTEKTKAIIIVHSYGNPFDIEAITDFFNSKNIAIIEDCAEAHGAEIRGRKIGSLGLISAFSFYANKIITTGEGGAVLTNDAKIAEKLLVLRDHGMDKNTRFHHLVAGFNYRMTNLQGSIGLSQLKRIDSLIKERDTIAKIYNEGLKNLGFTMAKIDDSARAVNWLYTTLCPAGIERDELALYLKNNEVETRPMFRPISSFPYIEGQGNNKNAYEISSRGISLPTYNGITEAEQNTVIDLIKDFVVEKNLH